MAALVAYLMLGRFLRTGRLRDLLLGQGLLVLAVAGLGIVLALEQLGGGRTGTLDVWLRLIGAALIAGSALVAARPVRPAARRWARTSPWILILAVTVVLAAFRDRLPRALAAAPPTSAEHPVIAGSPVHLATHAATALCFVVASLVLAAQATRTRDELLRWVGPAFALAPCRDARTLRHNEPMPHHLVALGDSTVEGLIDPGPDGAYVGWADRFAAHLAERHPDLLYANLAVRGQTSHEVRATQLQHALELAPDTALLMAGVNDLLRPRLDRGGLRDNLMAMYGALHDCGARVLTFTMPDMTRVAPLATLLRGRIDFLNAVIREAGSTYGAVVVDFAHEPVAGHPALWHDDRLHANSDGHRRIAAALAEAVGLGAEDWRDAPGEPVASGVVRIAAREAAWLAGHFGPWLWGRLRGHPFDVGDGAKRPDLSPVTARALDSSE